MKIIKSSIFAFICILFSCNLAFAQSQSVQGMASLVKDSKTLTTAELEQLKSNALNHALTRYSANFGINQQALFSQKQSTIRANIHGYFTDVAILENTYDKKSDVHSMVVRGFLNTSKLDSVLNAAAQGSSNQSNTMTVLFVARETASKDLISDKSTRIRESESVSENNINIDGTQSNSLSNNSADFGETAAESQHNKSITVTKTGGRTVVSEDIANYTKTTSAKINASMSKVLTDNNFDIVAYEYIIADDECAAPKEELIHSEFAQADKLSAQVNSQLTKAAKRCEINILAIGTMDAGGATTDPVTGNRRVNVAVRFQVFTLEKRFPRTVASIGPVQFSGLGKDRSEALNNALLLASEEAALKIVSALRAKGY